jgi:hypothetical protein
MGCPPTFVRDRPRTRGGFSTPSAGPSGRGQTQGTVPPTRLYGPPQTQPSQPMTNVSVTTVSTFCVLKSICRCLCLCFYFMMYLTCFYVFLVSRFCPHSKVVWTSSTSSVYSA